MGRRIGSSRLPSVLARVVGVFWHRKCLHRAFVFIWFVHWGTDELDWSFWQLKNCGKKNDPDLGSRWELGWDLNT